MPGGKSTLKEHWRQVPAEPAKILWRHLLTLKPWISALQTNQLQAADLQLVIPLPIHDSYAEGQQAPATVQAELLIFGLGAWSERM